MPPGGRSCCDRWKCSRTDVVRVSLARLSRGGYEEPNFESASGVGVSKGRATQILSCNVVWFAGFMDPRRAPAWAHHEPTTTVGPPAPRFGGRWSHFKPARPTRCIASRYKGGEQRLRRAHPSAPCCPPRFSELAAVDDAGD